LDATAPNSTYLWHDNSTNPSWSVSQQGTYWITVSNSCGTVPDTINIIYNTVPTVNLGNDTTLCQGQSTTLNASGFNDSYLWSDGSTNSSFNVTQQGTYWAEVTNNCGVASDTVKVNFNTLPALGLGNDTLLCSGSILSLDATFANSTYVWHDNSTNPIFIVTQQGIYWITATNMCGVASDTLRVDYDSLPVVELGNDTLVCAGDSFLVDATASNKTYLWHNNSTDPTFLTTEQGTFWVEVSNVCGVQSDTITVLWDNCDCYVHVPNAFTPNADDINDQFLPVPHCTFASYNFVIYDRWGDLIFETIDPQVPWDGKANKGKELGQQDVYVWMILAMDDRGQRHQYVGHVTLVR